jgi:hypothetical protein
MAKTKRIPLPEAYINYVETNHRKPLSILDFCSFAGIKESEFYGDFTTLESVEEATWTELVKGTQARLADSTEYSGYTPREKLLAFYFTFFEEALKHRSYYIQAAGDLKNPALLKMQRFRNSCTEFFKELTREGMESGTVPNRFNAHTLYPHGAWVQFLFLWNFWATDRSKGFERTDEAIERSVNLVFDLSESNALDTGIGFVSFLFRQMKPV